MRKCPALKWFTPSSRRCGRRLRAIASWSDASLFGRVAGCRGADLPRLIEEPAEPRTQKRQGPPIGRAMNIRPRAGKLCDLDNPELPQLRPVSQPLKVATGMLVPASDAGGLRTTEGQPSYAHTPPPGEGFRSWPCRAAGPQRQGPYCRLRTGLERPEPAAAPTPRADHQGLPGRAGGAAVGLPQQPIRRLLPELREDRGQGASAPAARLPRR